MTQLPILHSHRPEYGWVERLAHLREAYERKTAGDPERAFADASRIDAWLVFHSLRLKGEEITLEQVEAARLSGGTASIAGAFAAVARMREAAASGGLLDSALLLETNRLVDPERGGRFREGAPVAAYKGHTAPPPDGLDALVVNASEWFLAESFTAELHPVEQSALALVRVCDLQPFPSNNELTARIAASFFLLRAGWPPLVVREELEAEYRKAILHAMHMDTMPAVELVAKCVARVYDDLLGWNVHELVDE